MKIWLKGVTLLLVLDGFANLRGIRKFGILNFGLLGRMSLHKSCKHRGFVAYATRQHSKNPNLMIPKLADGSHRRYVLCATLVKSSLALPSNIFIKTITCISKTITSIINFITLPSSHISMAPIPPSPTCVTTIHDRSGFNVALPQRPNRDTRSTDELRHCQG